MCVQTLYSLQAYIITVLVGLIVRYLWCSIFGVRISGIPSNKYKELIFTNEVVFARTYAEPREHLHANSCCSKL